VVRVEADILGRGLDAAALLRESGIRDQKSKHEGHEGVETRIAKSGIETAKENGEWSRWSRHSPVELEIF